MFQAVSTTPLLRFKDDIVVELRDGGRITEVHVRGKSRVGKNDWRAHERRILLYFDQILAIMAAEGIQIDVDDLRSAYSPPSPRPVRHLLLV